MNNEINICFATDNNYIDFTLMAMYSIIKTTKDYPLHFYILGNNADLSVFNAFSKFPEVSVTTYSDDLNKTIGNYKPGRYITSTTYFRLLIPELEVFKDVDKVLYLDQDIIAVKSIAAYYNHDISNVGLGVIKDFGCANVYNKSPVNLKLYRYFYAGQLLMNLPVLRKRKFTEKCLNDLKKTKQNDQIVINRIAFVEKNFVKYLDPKYCFSWHKTITVKGNYNKIALWNKTYGTNYKSMEDLTNNSVIWHFHGDKKQMMKNNKRINDLITKYINDAKTIVKKLL